MKLASKQRQQKSSATITQAMVLIVGCSAVFLVSAYAADPANWNDPAWWSSRNAVNGNTANNSAVVNQGELKQFTVAAYNELNADLAGSGGAGATLSNMVYGWRQDYLTNGYATNTANPSYPYKPSDFQAVNVGQVKYIARQVYGQLYSAGYTGLYPSWLASSNAADLNAATIGQVKEAFDFNLSVAPAAVANLTASTTNPNEIDLSWTLPSMNNATSIQVLMSSDGGTSWTTVSTLSPTATAYAAQGLAAGQGYLFRVVIGNSANSTTTPISSSITATAPAPAIVSAYLGANNSVNLSWSESNPSGVTGYNVLQSTNGGQSFATVNSVGAGVTSAALTGLPGAMDTSQFEVQATAGSGASISSPITPVASPTPDTDGDGTMDNVDGWAGFTDPVQETKLAPPRLANPSYVGVPISTIPNTYTIDFVNHQGQAVVHSTQTDSYGIPSNTYYFWDKGATSATPLPTPVNFTDPFWSGSPVDTLNKNALPSETYPVQLRQPTGLSDAGTVIGYDMMQDNTPFYTNYADAGLEQGWRWTKGMAQVQLLADLDSIDQVTSINDSGWSEFQTVPTFIQSINGVEKIYAYHQESGFYSGALLPMQAYTEVYSVSASSTSSTPPLPPTLYYGTDQTDKYFNDFDVGNNISNLIGGTTTPQNTSHESRLPSQDNGNGTVIGTGATMATYHISDAYGNTGPSLDANVQIPSGFTITRQLFFGQPLEPQPGSTNAPPGGGMIVNTANGNNYRQWINGTATAVNSAGYVLGLQNSTSPANPVANAGYLGSYYSYNDTNNVPFPTIWAPQTNNAGAVTSYNAIGLTMPQTGLSFQGNAGLFFNKNLQIAGGKSPPAQIPYAPYDAPFLWQNYQYHNLSDFYPGITNYSAFQVKALDDSDAITAIATPSSPANASQQILQLLPADIKIAKATSNDIDYETDGNGYVPIDGGNVNGSTYTMVSGQSTHFPTKRDVDANNLPVDNPQLIHLLTELPAGMGTGYQAQLTVQNNGRGRVKFWKDRRKQNEYVAGTPLAFSSFPKDLYVEGTVPGAAQQEINLKLQIIVGSQTSDANTIKLTVTPVLTNYQVYALFNDSPVYSPVYGQPWLFSGAEDYNDENIDIVATVFQKNALGRLQHIQTLSIGYPNGHAAALYPGDPATTSPLHSWVWQYAPPNNGQTLVDLISDTAFPYYKPDTSAPQGDTAVVSIEDNPTFSLQTIKPTGSQISVLDMTWSFTDYAVWVYPDGTAYPLGQTTWNVRWSGRLGVVLTNQIIWSPDSNNMNNVGQAFQLNNTAPTLNLPSAIDAFNGTGAGFQ